VGKEVTCSIHSNHRTSTTLLTEEIWLVSRRRG
jgi:hypothetical protein